ncbi:uncharacterized protein [Venturia canescens]|uniref:uncharacterized protein n=1 Tax=Venturia canescens TaxID=32260 RepID=UPI001C9D1458|nr:uncharacterized protein LOC122413631 [Venturia canescens]XP_043280034.1 uncharacterized protein LOC122413631 [Venturia canescens]XP_043280035.1 uncharacterized protein LOC122413631 [Venturia canescens]
MYCGAPLSQLVSLGQKTLKGVHEATRGQSENAKLNSNIRCSERGKRKSILRSRTLCPFTYDYFVYLSIGESSQEIRIDFDNKFTHILIVMKICVLLLAVLAAFASGQRITTIQLDGVQYFISRMNPYSPELNYFLAYQYCRSLGLQLASFETKEKADTLTQYLRNAGYTKYDFWTSGNHLGTDMFLWMSTGLPFNGTFDYMLRRTGNRAVEVPPGTEPQRVARESADSGSADGCVAMVAPNLAWEAQDCGRIKDFICEQTRCYYYNYGSIPVSATQGNRRPYLTTTTSPNNDIDEDHVTNKEGENRGEAEEPVVEETSSFEESHSDANDLEDEETASTGSLNNERIPEDPIVGRLMSGASSLGGEVTSVKSSSSIGSNEEAEKKINPEESDGEEEERKVSIEVAKSTRPDDIPDITSLFTDGPIVPRKETVFDGLETHEIRSSSRSNTRGKLEHREIPEGSLTEEKNADESVAGAGSSEQESHTIGPYDSVQEDYVNDQPDEDPTSDTASVSSSLGNGATGISGNEKEQQQQDEDSSTFLPEAEPDYRYNMKWRSMGKVLDPPSN